jgi:4-amino-4-deoxy-L-arabinose transferase-like glycosyltransferase
MRAALRRLAIAVLLCVGVTAAASALIGLLIGASIDRSLVLGFYLMGCFLMVAGFFAGNRGPTRVKSESPAASAMPFGVFSGARRLRWATLGEQDEAINNSAVFVGLGIVLVVVGVLLDGRHSIF